MAALTDGTPAPPSAAPENNKGSALRGPAIVGATLGVVAAEFLILDAVHRYIDNMLVADLLYAFLLVVASVGWMAWFRKLVTRHRLLERSLTEEQARTLSSQRLAALVRGSADAILVSDGAGRIDYASPSVETVLGMAPSVVEGRRFADLLADGEHDAFALLIGILDRNAESAVQTKMTHADGRTINVEGSVANLLDDEAVNGMVVTVRDVTDRVQLESALTEQAFHDSLTGLANRQLFSDRLEHALQARSSDESRSVVVLYCDLDEFKIVNDSRGHGAGDKVLVEVAHRASELVRAGDTIARLGGDEFAVLLNDADVETAVEISERLCAALGEPMIIDGDTLRLGASIGVASARAGTLTAEALLRNADVAMYLAKGRGKRRVAVYDAALHAAALRKIDVRLQLQEALAAGEIGPHYQPTVDLRTGQIAGFEALARWIDADGTEVPPTEFIPVAEQCGAIHELGNIILRTACADAVAFSNLVGRPLEISVNVTVSQMCRDDFVADVMAILVATGLNPRQLVLEITESELAQQPGLLEQQMAALRVHGIRIAIDDFGTGFSSLSCLRTLEIDVLKIDKAFIDDVTDGAHGSALALAIVALGSSVSLTTVAEGVERPEQAGWLAGTDCTYGQGFLWSRAVSRDDACSLLTDFASERAAESEALPAS